MSHLVDWGGLHVHASIIPTVAKAPVDRVFGVGPLPCYFNSPRAHLISDHSGWNISTCSHLYIWSLEIQLKCHFQFQTSFTLSIAHPLPYDLCRLWSTLIFLTIRSLIVMEHRVYQHILLHDSLLWVVLPLTA